MQDGYRILESGKSGKMAKIYQHHKFPPCLGNPSMGQGRGESYTLFQTLPQIVAFLIYEASILTFLVDIYSPRKHFLSFEGYY